MSPKEIEQIVSKLLQGGVSINLWSYGIFALIMIATYYLSPYLRKKGEYLATKEDFNELLNQVKKSTEATEKIKNEFYLTKATYDRYIDTVLNFYNNIYKYYRSCQKASASTHIKYPDGSEKTTKEIYEETLNQIALDHKSMEGYIRLLLPKQIQELDSKLIDSFNNFRDIVKSEPVGPETIKKLQDCFNNEIDRDKNALEEALQQFLKIDKFSTT